jgi:hypothetical protein
MIETGLLAVIDLIDHLPDKTGFIVMEEWSSQLITDDGPGCLNNLLAGLRQCIEVGRFSHQISSRSLT